VSSRDERVARNEATTREINEGIEQAHQAASTPEHIRIVCECGRLERVVAETDRYAVVAKREGTPAAVAVEEDPRG
jgi:hypothetical protein